MYCDLIYSLHENKIIDEKQSKSKRVNVCADLKKTKIAVCGKSEADGNFIQRVCPARHGGSMKWLLVALLILVAGIQIGIRHGRNLGYAEGWSDANCGKGQNCEAGEE